MVKILLFWLNKQSSEWEDQSVGKRREGSLSLEQTSPAFPQLRSVRSSPAKATGGLFHIKQTVTRRSPSVVHVAASESDRKAPEREEHPPPTYRVTTVKGRDGFIIPHRDKLRESPVTLLFACEGRKFHLHKFNQGIQVKWKWEVNWIEEDVGVGGSKEWRDVVNQWLKGNLIFADVEWITESAQWNTILPTNQSSSHPAVTSCQ